MISSIFCRWQTIIDKKEAQLIAENFVVQNFSVIKVEEPVLKEGIWHVGVLVSSNDARTFHLEINAKTGRVMGFSRNKP